MAKKKTQNKKPPGRKASRLKRRLLPRRTEDRAKVQSLIHELQVHAEEITVQNEQLLKAQGELEEARDRFADLYDFAPVGYLTLDRYGTITEINLAGAALLGRARSFLINMPLTAMITREHRDRLQRFLTDPQKVNTLSTSIEVMARTDGQHILRLVMRSEAGPGGQLFAAMVDVTEERRFENERREALAREQTRAAQLATEVGERVAAEARIKALLERLVTAQEEERRRIARNLHDHLGQQLTALRLTLSSIKEDAAAPPIRERIAIVEEMVLKLDRDVDLLAWDLRPATLDDLGLAAALTELVRQWTTLTSVPAEVHCTVDLHLPGDVESNVYRIVQEALNNIAKHAAATQVSVLIEQRGSEAAITIEDDGRGFDPDRALEAHGRHAGMGLIGMQERASLIDGDVQIESSPGDGTTIFVRIPMISARAPAK